MSLGNRKRRSKAIGAEAAKAKKALENLASLFQRVDIMDKSEESPPLIQVSYDWKIIGADRKKSALRYERAKRAVFQHDQLPLWAAVSVWQEVLCRKAQILKNVGNHPRNVRRHVEGDVNVLLGFLSSLDALEARVTSEGLKHSIWHLRKKILAAKEGLSQLSRWTKKSLHPHL